MGTSHRACLPPLDSLAVIGAVEHHRAVLADKVCCAQPHLEVHLPSAKPEKVWLQLGNPVCVGGGGVLCGHVPAQWRAVLRAAPV